MRTRGPRRTGQKRLTREHWLRAALSQISERGLAGINVAGLAASLHVTTGSFYWHFTSRDELLEAALDLWESERIDVLDALRDIGAPRARLERIVGEIYRDRGRGELFAALQASATDPRVGSRLRRTTQRRLGFLAQTYRELGYPAAKARYAALALYSLYTGLWELTRILPATDEHAVPDDRMSEYIEYLRDLVLR
ncbi:MAG TPA: TetR family transcriptional regulator [Pseudomonadota bacterium]|nr:TetR family transcriptional regulator [Pseudomonadota bacterium]